MRSNVTLKNVADLAGVSKATASMILNGDSSSFSESTVESVRKASASLGYRKPVVNNAALNLQSNAILIVNPNVHNLYFPTLIQYIESAVRQKGLSTFVYNTYRDPEKERELLHTLMSSNWKGVIYTYAPSNVADIEKLNYVMPAVVIGEYNLSADVNTIGVDYYKAGCIIAEHLIDLGHRNAAFVSTPIGSHNLFRARRWQGVMDTFAKAGDEYTLHSLIARPTQQMELRLMRLEHTTGFNMTRQALWEDPEITAFIGVNDQVAYGIIDYLRTNGYRVPQDYSVCGFDNVVSTPYSDILITTVEPASQERSISAVEIIMEELQRREHPNGESRPYYKKIEHQNRFVAGNSTAEPRKTKQKKGEGTQ